MRGNLLGDNQYNNQYNDTQFSSLDMDSRPSGFMHQNKTIKSWKYYTLIVLVSLLAIFFVVCAAGWAAASHNAKSDAPPSPPGPPGPPTPTGNATDLPNVLLPIVPKYPENTLMGQVKTYDLIAHLSTVYQIAMKNGGNRAVVGPGFNATVDWLLDRIAQTTNLQNVERTYFLYKTASGTTQTSFTLTAGGVVSEPAYSSDWTSVQFSTSILPAQNFDVMYVVDGCNATNWPGNPPAGTWVIAPANRSCSVPERSLAASAYGAAGFIVPNDATGNPLRGALPFYLDYQGIMVSKSLGQTIIDALQANQAVSMQLAFSEQHAEYTVSNICGDTPTGNPTSVVLVGGHSDGVISGPGTNDDGSGSTATLILAQAVTRLMNNGSYNLQNMIKFCWFGAEEQGLYGSKEIVRQGLIRNHDLHARVGSRAKDWAMMIDLDMLASMNYMNYIYDANQHIPGSTPASAFNGSRTQTNLFFDFFKQNNLPCDSDRFDGRSDYGPFLEVGIPAGGVDAGADKTKNESTRARYQEITGWGGVAGKALDQCYHKACDTIMNIHWGVYTNMTMSAAYVLEQFALHPNLRSWIDYPIPVEMHNPAGKAPFVFKSRPSHPVDEDIDEMY